MLVLPLMAGQSFFKTPDRATTAYQLIAMLHPALLYLCGLVSMQLHVSVTVTPCNQLIVVVFNYDCCFSIMIVVSIVIITVFCQP